MNENQERTRPGTIWVPGLLLWRGLDLNQRPSGYEFAKAHIGEYRCVPKSAVYQGFRGFCVSASACG